MLNLCHTNYVIDTYVPVTARNHLYGFFDRLRGNAIYCDTDWVIFIQPRPQTWSIVTGDKLGDMQSEMKTQNPYRNL